MSLWTLVTTTQPSISGTGDDYQPRVRQTQFGDGYVQRFTDGLNANLATIQVVWEALPAAEANAILSFLSQLGGVTPFLWGCPLDQTVRIVVCSRWSRRYVSGTLCTVSATFSETADLTSGSVGPYVAPVPGC